MKFLAAPLTATIVFLTGCSAVSHHQEPNLEHEDNITAYEEEFKSDVIAQYLNSKGLLEENPSLCIAVIKSVDDARSYIDNYKSLDSTCLTLNIDQLLELLGLLTDEKIGKEQYLNKLLSSIDEELKKYPQLDRKFILRDLSAGKKETIQAIQDTVSQITRKAHYD
ncbi:MAG: hypothetical protein PHE67_02275 [Campylobacterales bacterium]|jgi:hypothetical protein|nr:hypothetical protein [Campylobacterales bacterium]